MNGKYCARTDDRERETSILLNFAGLDKRLLAIVSANSYLLLTNNYAISFLTSSN